MPQYSGSNAYEQCDTIVITGRNQPPPKSVEALARAVWWADDEPLQFDAAARPDAAVEEHLPLELRGYRTADPDKAAGVKVGAFTDWRIEAVHGQIREAETTQALARLRLVRAVQPKHVFLLSNLPVDVTVDRLVTWDDLMPNQLDQLWWEHGGLPDTPRGLQVMHPDVFGSSAAADNARRRHGREHHAPYLPTICHQNRVLVTFRQLRDGRPYGRTQSHTFELDWSGEDRGTGVLPLSTIRLNLEQGVNGTGGWGPVQIESIGFVDAPDDGAPGSGWHAEFSVKVLRDFC